MKLITFGLFFLGFVSCGKKAFKNDPNNKQILMVTQGQDSSKKENFTSIYHIKCFSEQAQEEKLDFYSDLNKVKFITMPYGVIQTDYYNTEDKAFSAEFDYKEAPYSFNIEGKIGYLKKENQIIETFNECKWKSEDVALPE